MRPTTGELLDLLRDHGGALVSDGELIRYCGPALTEELRGLIREHKPRLLDLLRDDIEGCATCGSADTCICAPSGTFYCFEHRHQSGLCSDCGRPIPIGSTLCAECGGRRSRLVQWALEHGAKQAQSVPTEAAATPAPARTGSPRRCTSCGHSLSVLNVVGLCGRCVLPHSSSATSDVAEKSDQEEERHLRGRALVALDKHGYPRLVLADGSVGPGLEAWGPVLREMGGAQLRALIGVIEGTEA